MNAPTKRQRRNSGLLTKQLARQRQVIQSVIIRAGSQQALARQLGVSQAAISKWLIRGYFPLDRAVEIEALYGVPRAEIANPKVVAMLTPAESLMPVLAGA